MNIENSKAQMRKGVLELCILSIIDAEKSIYPSDIIKNMKAASLMVVEGTLYPLLTRLKNGGLLRYNWVESKSGPPRKYYELTEIGKTSLKDLTQSWNDLVQSVSAINHKPT